MKEIIKTVGITIVAMVIVNNAVNYLPASVQKLVRGQ
jgi:hypothetical protein